MDFELGFCTTGKNMININRIILQLLINLIFERDIAAFQVRNSGGGGRSREIALILKSSC
jgi:hypothetical protein